MAVQYKHSKHAYYTDPESLTEQEHADSCDINIMIRNAQRGHDIRGGPAPVYGHDDLTIDGVQHRIRKEQTERELAEIARTQEFTEEELSQMRLNPEQQKKFGFKVKKKAAPPPAKNDDQTTKPPAPQPPKKDPKDPEFQE